MKTEMIEELKHLKSVRKNILENKNNINFLKLKNVTVINGLMSAHFDVFYIKL